MKVLVIADIHGNATALEAVLDREQDADRVVFLGDTVSPGPQPNETFELMQSLPGGTLISGNHDHEVLNPELFANYPAPWLAFYSWVVDVFDAEGVEFLKTLKPAGNYEEGGVPMYLCHGMVQGGPRHTLPNSPDESFTALARGNRGAEYVLFGHSHVQFQRVVDGQTFINPGSVGQNRCGNQVACYGVFEDGVYRPCQVPIDTRPWVEALERVEPLNEHPDFRDWLKEGMQSGFGVGKNEPWTTFAAQGYT